MGIPGFRLKNLSLKSKAEEIYCLVHLDFQLRGDVRFISS